MHHLDAWMASPDPAAFPYDPVVEALRDGGRHFAEPALLDALERVRELRAGAPDCEAGRLLDGFLHTALDKRDGRFDNPSYLALRVLPLPGTGERPGCPMHAMPRRDRLFSLLLADLLRFELDAHDGATGLLPEMRACRKLLAKRCRLALRAMLPALARQGIVAELQATCPVAAAREACAAVEASLEPHERRYLQLSTLPVYVLHDEYMFMRVLQSYETTFSFAGVQLSAALAAIAAGRGDHAAQAIDAAASAMAESKPLFSLIGTMRAEAFLRFREFTDGASAIQSRSYKLVESLCRRPDAERLDSPGYRSVPEVRRRVLDGAANIDGVLREALASGALPAAEAHGICCAMKRFEAVMLAWRKTHHSIAVRMLGKRRGTGYTEGVPYLEHVRSLAVFTQRPGCLAAA